MSLRKSWPRFAPQLKRRITIEQPSLTPDGLGGYTRNWTALATVWGSIEPLSGGEQVFAGKLESHVTHQVTIRYRSDVRADMRLVYKARIFTIRAMINVDEAGRILEILAEEGVAS